MKGPVRESDQAPPMVEQPAARVVDFAGPGSGSNVATPSAQALEPHRTAQTPEPGRPSFGAEISEPVHKPVVVGAREVSVRFEQPQGEGPRATVEVQVVERRGEVHVSVRTPDPQLTGELRAHLPELVERVVGHGYEAETWTPVESAAPNGGARMALAEASAGSKDSESSSRDQTGAWPQQDPGRNRRQSQQEWNEDLEGIIDPEKPLQGLAPPSGGVAPRNAGEQTVIPFA